MKLIAEGIIAQSETGPVLIGGCDRETGTIVFPMPQGPEAGRYEPIKLKTHGRLWSYTVQRFPPKPPYIGPCTPEAFAPFAVGYVELEGEVIVESRIATDAFDTLHIGQLMELTLIPFAEDETGTPIHTFAFKPAG